MSAIRDDERRDSDARPDGVTIMGERFVIEVEPGEGGDIVYLVHPGWSVMGSGRTVEEAERDLRAEARELGQILAEKGPDRFTRGGREMRDFVMKFLAAPA